MLLRQIAGYEPDNDSDDNLLLITPTTLQQDPPEDFLQPQQPQPTTTGSTTSFEIGNNTVTADNTQTPLADAMRQLAEKVTVLEQRLLMEQEISGLREFISLSLRKNNKKLRREIREIKLELNFQAADLMFYKEMTYHLHSTCDSEKSRKVKLQNELKEARKELGNSLRKIELLKNELNTLKGKFIKP